MAVEMNNGKVRLYQGDSRDVLKTLPDNSIDSIVCDPPYALVSIQKRFGKAGAAPAKHGTDGAFARAARGFMNATWDVADTAFAETFWAECLRVLKPGGHVVAFGGTRTYHRLVVAIEDAGFEIRDQLGWVYGSGLPKSHDVSKGIDKRGGAKVSWFGPWLKAWRAENAIKQSDVSALFPSRTGGKTGCVANWELGLNMPTPDQFNLICSTFGLPFASMEEAERTITQQAIESARPGEAVAFDQRSSSERERRDIPATDAARQWQGWGTALKPAWEPICLARKPLIGTVADNVLEHGTGAINIDGCRVGTEERTYEPKGTSTNAAMIRVPDHRDGRAGESVTVQGRWPANLIWSVDEDEYELRSDVTKEQKTELYGWLSAKS